MKFTKTGYLIGLKTYLSDLTNKIGTISSVFVWVFSIQFTVKNLPLNR